MRGVRSFRRVWDGGFWKKFERRGVCSVDVVEEDILKLMLVRGVEICRG